MISLEEVKKLHLKLQQTIKMYNKNAGKDPIVAAVTASLGAGVATSFAVAQGQNPLLALGITAFAATVAVLCDRLGWL
jgi:fatty acid desaturase